MSAGRFIAVVGPSGVGKDSVMDGLCARCPDVFRVRRDITRAPEQGGEDYTALSDAEFEMRASAGAYALHWGAHDLRYGIPQSVFAELEAGRDILANLSRSVLGEAAQRFERVLVLHITTRPEVLAARLAGRGRESVEEIARRLSRPSQPLPEHLNIIEIDNSGPLDVAVEKAAQALFPVTA